MITDHLLNPTIADRSLSVILQKIRSIHSSEVAIDSNLPDWKDIEPEVWVDALTEDSDPLSADQLQRLAIKISLLIKLFSSEDHPDFEDVFYEVGVTLKLAEVLNNVDAHLSDADAIPHVTSLELAWFLDEIQRVTQMDDASMALICPEVAKVCAYCLHYEGYPSVVYPFSLFLRNEDIHRYWLEGEVPDVAECQESLELKKKAIEVYVTLMRKHLC